eukprot:12912739-Prorocentrum_lima.AAC.1
MEGHTTYGDLPQVQDKSTSTLCVPSPSPSRSEAFANEAIAEKAGRNRAWRVNDVTGIQQDA